MMNSEAGSLPLYYYYFFPPYFCMLQSVTAQFGLKCQKVETPSNQIPMHVVTEQIILTRDDLQREGYKQAKKPWSKEQDRLLLRLCRNEQARFQEIASQIEGRNAKMCYSRFRRLSYQTKVIWTQEQDDRLMMLVQQYGEEHWKHFESYFKGRTHKQIRDHYENSLKPDINHNEWSLEEDMTLIALINQYGKNWKEIEDRMPGRSRNQIKNRYFGKIYRLNMKKLVQMEKSDQISL